jgi:SecD/SecF fusion protein
VQFELREPMKIEEVRSAIDGVSKQFPKQLPSPAVVSVGSDRLMYEVVTPNPIGKDVRDAVVKAIGDKLKVERESLFKNVGANLVVARETGTVMAIVSDELKIDDHVIASAADHVGGVAVLMKDIDPMLSVEQIRGRIEKQRLQPQPGGKMLPYRDMDVEVVEPGPGNLAKSAVVLISDPKYPVDKDEARWTEELAGPTWTLVNDAINNPPQLQKVTNFDAQVASAAQMRALTALILSTIVIMIYIWFRFGDLTFGTAATVATIHDTLFVLAAVGFAHYLATTPVGSALLIEPFRINLTLVAAVLTVMGYSMNDTVVVFDRIRENRGKSGVVTAKLINDAVNQTLSRTLLTGGTTIVTIFVMYLFGGSGIHGFTFVLLIGIIVGTYSSIGVASPILLFGPDARKAKSKSRPKTAPAPAAG